MTGPQVKNIESKPYENLVDPAAPAGQGPRVAELIDRLSRLTRELQYVDGLNPAQWEALRFLSRANKYSRTPGAVAQFLGDWFEWGSLQDMVEQADEPQASNAEMNAEDADQPPQMVNFWPAVIGWIVGLAILATLFGGMGGGG